MKIHALVSKLISLKNLLILLLSPAFFLELKKLFNEQGSGIKL